MAIGDPGHQVVTTARGLARAAGVSVAAASRWLSGQSRPSVMALRLLADQGVTLDLPPFKGRPVDCCHYKPGPASDWSVACRAEFGPTTFWTKDLERVTCQTCLRSRVFRAATQTPLPTKRKKARAKRAAMVD